MNSTIKTGIVALAVLFTTSSLLPGQKRGNGKPRLSPNAEISQTIGTTVVSLTYGRPGLKGRTLESLVPDGKVWRTGANESTVITFSDDVMIGDASIDAGTYSLYTLPNDGKLTIIINEKLSWGTQYDESMDVARTTVDVSRENHHVEWFAIYFDALTDTVANLNLRWGDAHAVVPVTVK